MMRPEAKRQAEQPAKLPGVIDAIADGLSMVLERPLLMAVPVLLDLYYWAGWKLTATQLVEPIQREVAKQNASDSQRTLDALEKVGRADLLWLLSALVPALVPNINRSDLYTLGERPVLTPPAWTVALSLPLILVAALIITLIFMVPLADCVVDRHRSLSATARAVVMGSLRMFAAFCVMAGIVALLIAPILIGTLILIFVGVNPAALLGLTSAIAFFAAVIAFWFVPNAIVVSEVGPLRAIRDSVSIVRRHFWQSVWLITAVVIITAGLGSLFTRIADTAPGLLIGVIGNAFIGTGLAIASMGFYANRISSPRPGAIAFSSDSTPRQHS
jgi:hypothetical protein